MQEKQIRARQSIKQLGNRMRTQRLQVTDKVKKSMGQGAAQLIPKVRHLGLWWQLLFNRVQGADERHKRLQEMEHGLKELVTGVEQTVERILSGELGFEMTKHADKCAPSHPPLCTCCRISQLSLV